MIQPISVNNPKILTEDVFWMIGFAAVLIPLMLLPKRFVVGRYKGMIILMAYFIFIYLTFSGEN